MAGAASLSRATINTQTQAMDAFAARFGTLTNGVYVLPATFLSYSNAFPFLLLICGIGIGSMISSRFGRRMTVFCMSLWTMICVPIIVTSTGTSQFLAGRCLNSIYIGMEMSVIPNYQSEIVPAAVRGLAVASYQMSFSVGGFLMSGICHQTSPFDHRLGLEDHVPCATSSVSPRCTRHGLLAWLRSRSQFLRLSRR